MENSATAFTPLNSGNTLPPPQTIFFTNVYTEPNIIPSKQFRISADIQSVNPSQLLVSISAPSGVSVTSPVVAKLENSGYGNTVRATWTLVTSKTGSYPITINAVSNFPIDSQQFNLDVTVGYSNSLVTSIDVPGSIIPNTIFPVTLSLKNILGIPDGNITAQISVPNGLSLLNNQVTGITSIAPSQQVKFRWNVRADEVGNYPININYTSTIGGSNMVTVNVNVGKFSFADISTKSVTINGIPSTMPSAAPGDKLLPVVVRLVNSGTIPIYNINATLISGNVFVVKTLQNESNTSDHSGNVVNLMPGIFQIGTLDVGTTTDAVYFVDISKNIVPGTYNSFLSVTFSDGNKQYSKILTFPVLISDTGIKISSVTLKGATSSPGDVADEINVKLINTGSYVSDVYTTLELPKELTPSWGNSTSAYFALINPYQTINASYYVNVAKNTVPGHLPMSMVITTQKGKTTLPMDFIVSPKAIFTLISVDDSQLYPGASNVPLKVTLENNGTISANLATSKLLAGNLIPGVKSSTLTELGNEENLGTILPGQVFTTTFIVSMDPSAKSGDQKASVEIDWTQNNAVTSFTQSVSVPLHVSEGASYLLYSGGIPWTYVLIVVVLISTIIVFSRMRKKRLELIRSSLQDESTVVNYIQPRDKNDEGQEMPHDST